MFSITERPLSSAARKALAESASYHGSLTRLRLIAIAKMTGVFAGLLAVVACIALVGFWWFDSLPDLIRRAPSLAWQVGAMYCFALLVAVWDSRENHEALCDLKAHAQSTLNDGKESEAVVEFDETSFAVPHEHGVLYFVDDGGGGSVVLDVSTVADDPREPQARQDSISTRWRLDCVGGGVRQARFSGRRIPIRRMEGLDECDEAGPEKILEALGFSGSQDLARVPLPIQEVERRMGSLLMRPRGTNETRRPGPDVRE
ncbi:MAG: hypothetical protein ACK5T2_14305 [bacterium]|jgi:type IV secretory pathway VirB2 component (pilin)